jgi:hypothetical protein
VRHDLVELRLYPFGWRAVCACDAEFRGRRQIVQINRWHDHVVEMTCGTLRPVLGPDGGTGEG